MNDDISEGPRTINSVQIAFQIVGYLMDNGRMGVTEVANACDLSKGAAYTHLVTLQEVGFVVKQGTKYAPSLRFLEAGNRVRNLFDIYKHGRVIANELAKETGEVVHLAVEQDHRVHYIYVARGGENSIQTATPIGTIQMLHATAAGKAIIAQYPVEAINDLIKNVGLPPLTKNTITDQDDLLAELETVRERGYAVNQEEQVMGAQTIATAIHHPNGQILGAICLSGPATRFDSEYEPELVTKVHEAANRIEIQLG